MGASLNHFCASSKGRFFAEVGKKKLVLILFTIAVVALSSAALVSRLKLYPDPPPEALSKTVGAWQLRVDGQVEHSFNVSIEEIVAMPKTTVDASLYCVDAPGSLITRGNWTGVRLGYIMDKAGVFPSTIKVAFYAEDDYSTDLNVTVARREDIILAYEKDGHVLPEKLRLVVPGMWGYKWISQLDHIEFVDYDFKGLSESHGYPD